MRQGHHQHVSHGQIAKGQLMFIESVALQSNVFGIATYE
jgi:hypothetical protein